MLTTKDQSLVELIKWIDENTSGITLPADERSLLASGCFDIVIEHQAAIALLYSSDLFGSMFALLRVLSESLVRGLWFKNCASEEELKEFQKGKLDLKFWKIVKDVEAAMGTPNGVLSGFKKAAWSDMNDFTHTGHIQISRRHLPGKIEANYPEEDIEKALGVAGALGLVAAGALIQMSNKQERLPQYFEQMSNYATKANALKSQSQN